VIFRGPHGAVWHLAAQEGDTVMDCAVDNGIPGITAQCGGGCTCSTCHCYLPRAWYAKAGPPEGDEADILEFTPGRRATSRLSCQIPLTPRLDGIEIQIPDSA
jgi:2Fe-2S ferredoxin